MAKFIFKLDGVLRQRSNVVQQRKRELASIMTRMTALEAELRSLDATVRAAELDLRTNRLVGVIDLAFLAAHRRFSLAMQRKAMGIAEKMAGVKLEVDQAKQKLAEASKRKKILEKLREQHYRRWREDLDRRDQAEMDEIAMRLSYADLTGAGTEVG
jgi:flagellar export protein FliJ